MLQDRKEKKALAEYAKSSQEDTLNELIKDNVLKSNEINEVYKDK